MAVTLLASECPGVQVAASLVTIAAAEAAHNAPVSEEYAAGQTVGLAAKLRKDATRQDLTGRYGGGVYGIAYGLAISAGTGLTVNVTAGHAMIDGPVEVPSNTTLSVPDDTARVWIWLRQSGVLTYTTSTTPPTGNNALLGSVVTSSGAVTSVDTSGVVYLRGGVGWRQTADLGEPSDTPAATVQLETRTQSGLWWWDGVAWLHDGGPLPLSRLVITEADPALVPDYFQSNIFDELYTYGTVTAYGTLRVL